MNISVTKPGAKRNREGGHGQSTAGHGTRTRAELAMALGRVLSPKILISVGIFLTTLSSLG